jgi:hypothetical protein
MKVEWRVEQMEEETPRMKKETQTGRAEMKQNKERVGKKGMTKIKNNREAQEMPNISRRKRRWEGQRRRTTTTTAREKDSLHSCIVKKEHQVSWGMSGGGERSNTGPSRGSSK